MFSYNSDNSAIYVRIGPKQSYPLCPISISIGHKAAIKYCFFYGTAKNLKFARSQLKISS